MVLRGAYATRACAVPGCVCVTRMCMCSVLERRRGPAPLFLSVQAAPGGVALRQRRRPRSQALQPLEFAVGRLIRTGKRAHRHDRDLDGGDVAKLWRNFIPNLDFPPTFYPPTHPNLI